MGLTYLGLAILSAAALAFEITLTRLFSVTQWYHFAFLAVSVALLGYGAAGTALSLVPCWTQPPTARRASWLSIAFAATTIAAYLSLDYLPFDSYRIAWERAQILYLVLYYLALAVPFFCAGLVTGLLLAAYPGCSAPLYAANLFGSALGGLVPVLLFSLVGEGAVLVIAVLGLLAAFVFQSVTPDSQHPPANHQRRMSGPFRAVLLACCLVLLLLSRQLPPLFQLRLSPYKGLSQVLNFPDAQTVWQEWNAFSRVDRIASSAIRSAPGLSLNYLGELPAEDGLYVDGDDLAPLIKVAGAAHTAEFRDFARHLPVALAYQLRPEAEALILEPRGGFDVSLAVSLGASSIVAVESNPLLIEGGASIYRDPRVEVVTEVGRTYARRSRETFDVVHLSLGDSYRPVTSGAFSLGERYDLTIEAFQDYLARLRPGGLLVIQRWLQLPPSEELRAAATAVEALRRAGVPDPAQQLAVLRDWQLVLILVNSQPFTPEELVTIRQFCRERGLDPVALPGLSEQESNEFNVLPEQVHYRVLRQLLDEPHALYAEHPYDVRPTTDDRPFFYHFFRWQQARAVLGQLGKTWQPWGGSGYFVLVALLAVALLASAALILVPLILTKGSVRRAGGQRTRVLIYFGLLGLAFLFAEIPLMQRFILFLGQPIYAFTAVVAALLLFSGLGSLAAPRLSRRCALALLALTLPLYPLGLSVLFRAFLGASLSMRLAVTVLALAPLGFLMGMPFTHGLVWLRERAPGLVTWAWAINGCTSVLSSILAAMIALSAGFSWVLVAAALSYALAWLALR